MIWLSDEGYQVCDLVHWQPLPDPPGHRVQIMKVAAKQCKTCIYRPNSPLILTQLEAEITDPKMPGFFKGHRICHSFDDADDDNVCCRGFWDRHKDHFTLGQIAQRLGFVEMIQEKAVAPPMEKS